ncbi:MAG: hypothetical protein CM1200mP18_07780 [Gammaproteobacteria bacterium]|nr:MAG: hypothetical protein CM1200mP18_07780 [Gammaproteobacteria bacterium]
MQRISSISNIGPPNSGPPMAYVTYSEHEAKEYLSAWGIPCPAGILVNSSADASMLPGHLMGLLR